MILNHFPPSPHSLIPYTPSFPLSTSPPPPSSPPRSGTGRGQLYKTDGKVFFAGVGKDGDDGALREERDGRLGGCISLLSCQPHHPPRHQGYLSSPPRLASGDSMLSSPTFRLYLKGKNILIDTRGTLKLVYPQPSLPSTCRHLSTPYPSG